MSTEILQLLLLGNVFLLGVVVTIAVRHFSDHSRPKNLGVLDDTVKVQLAESAKQEFTSVLESSGAALSNEMQATAKRLNRLLEQFGSDILQDEMQLFRNNLDIIRKRTENEASGAHRHITAKQADLETDIARQRDELAQRLIDHQARLESSLLQLQSSIEQSLKDRQIAFSKAMSDRENELDSNLEAELAKERELLIQQIDTKLGDAVGSFLINHLGTNVDLGAQTPYLMKLLEDHKDEFKREVGDAPHRNS